jgi:putative methyltransferase (TIGR04325 family)
MKRGVKEVSKRILPPILADAVNSFRGRQRSAPEWTFIGDSWSNSIGGKSWEDQSIVATQLAKWDQFNELVAESGPLGIAHEAVHLANIELGAHNDTMAFAYVLCRCRGSNTSVSMLDWGGGLGHYYVLAGALLPDLRIEYFCKDVPSIAEVGRRVLPDAKFFSTDHQAFQRTYDLVMASNSLQYSEDWREVLARLANVSRGYVYITRLPVVNESPSFVVAQRPHAYGYITEYQCWFLNRLEFLECARTSGLELVREFLTGARAVVPSAPTQAEHRGFLFRPAKPTSTGANA